MDGTGFDLRLAQQYFPVDERNNARPIPVTADGAGN
jgi:hypothetical protein